MNLQTRLAFLAEAIPAIVEDTDPDTPKGRLAAVVSTMLKEYPLALFNDPVVEGQAHPLNTEHPLPQGTDLPDPPYTRDNLLKHFSKATKDEAKAKAAAERGNAATSGAADVKGGEKGMHIPSEASKPEAKPIASNPTGAPIVSGPGSQ